MNPPTHTNVGRTTIEAYIRKMSEQLEKLEVSAPIVTGLAHFKIFPSCIVSLVNP